MSKTGKPKVFIIFSTVCLFLITMIGCHHSEEAPWVHEIGSDMDVMARGFEKWGTISMSSPILVQARPDANDFDFELSTGPDQYYKDARNQVQAQASAFEQSVEASGFGLTVQANIAAIMKYMADLQEYQRKLADYETGRTTERPAVPAPGKPEAPPLDEGVAPDADRAKGVLAGDRLTGFQGLLKGGPALSISNRSAITTAAGDTVTEAIFRLLGNPARAMKFKDKLIMFGVSMVSVSPGWLTKKDYTAELVATYEYDYDPARRELLLESRKKEKAKMRPKRDEKLTRLIEAVLKQKPIEKWKVLEKDEDGNYSKESKIKRDFIPQRLQKEYCEEYFCPLSSAVSPMTDVEALDLSSSQRQQVSNAISIAAALSHVGLDAQAAFFKEWARRTEQDVRTRTPYAAITAFSNGGFFGFRVRPRLKALENPAQFSSRPANILEQQAFPVVVIVAIDRDGLHLAFDVARDSNGKPVIEDCKVRLEAFEPLILFRQTVNWLPNESSKERLSETDRLRWASNYIKADDRLNSARDSVNELQGEDKDDIAKFIENRMLMLNYHILDSWSSQYIPLDLILNNRSKQPAPAKEEDEE
jgi:hypothetical protein